MPLEHYEVRFKNLDGKMIRRQITHIDGYENGSGPVLDLSRVGDERISSFDDIPYFYEIAPYLSEFSIGAPIQGKIDLRIFKKARKLSIHSFQCEIEGLEALYCLEYLDLSSTRFKKIDGIDDLKRLRGLGLTNANLDKIPVLGNLENLRKVDLSKNQISKIENLDGLENLNTLNLSKNLISKIEGLNGLENLYTLILRHNQISKIQGLNELSNLHQIFLSFNPISKIERLIGLNKLHTIYLSDTKIKSIAEIESIPNLESLNISNTEVSSLESLLKCPNIRSIRAENCPIRSLHGIHNDSNQLRNLIISPHNLCPTGAQLYKIAISRHTSSRNFDIHEIPVLLEFYRRSTTDLALQHANRSTSQPLTTPETERLIHEATQKERKILENAVDNEILGQDDPILSQITARFSIDISSNPKLKILL